MASNFKENSNSNYSKLTFLLCTEFCTPLYLLLGNRVSFWNGRSIPEVSWGQCLRFAFSRCGAWWPQSMIMNWGRGCYSLDSRISLSRTVWCHVFILGFSFSFILFSIKLINFFFTLRDKVILRRIDTLWTKTLFSVKWSFCIANILNTIRSK